jgi:phosphatidylethanolamine N-methyltransferase
MPPSLRSWSFSRIRVCSSFNIIKLFLTIPCIDIERRYGQRKPIAQRTPLYRPTPRIKTIESSQSTVPSPGRNSPLSATDAYTTPTVTDGETATESDALATELEGQLDSKPIQAAILQSGTFTPPKRKTGLLAERKKTKERGTSQHDLLNKYFRRDTVLLHNVDLFR